MFARGLVACALAAALAAPVRAQTREITLAEALRRAAELNPDIRTAGAELAAARGGLRGARLFTYNPEISVGVGRVGFGDTSLVGFDFALSQRFELGGKRGARIRGAESRSAAAEARLARRRQEVAARVYQAFVLALIARLRAETAREAEQVTADAQRAASERLALGGGTLLEVNVAAAAVSRDRRVRLEAERSYASAVIELARAIGLPPEETAEPAGAPELPAPDARAESTLVALAVERRADLRAAAAERAAAEADVRFARGLAWPDPAVGALVGRDDVRRWQLTLSVPIPLLNRGQGAQAQARAELERARIAEGALRRQVEFEVRDAYQAYMRAREALAAFERGGVERLAQNLQLAQESFRAGKINFLVFNTVRRELVDARLAYVDAFAEVVRRQADLALAVGDISAIPTQR